MTFAKLDQGITKSSVWNEKYHVRIVWVAFLAEKDETGFVSGSRTGMARVSNVTQEEFDEAEKVLSSPDPDSRTLEFEGRRIEKIEGGWIVLNHEKYRLPEQEKAENRREYMKEYMRNKRSVNSVNSVNVNSELTSVSVSDSVSVSKSLEEFRETFLKDVNTFSSIYPSDMLSEFIDYWTEKNHTGKKMRFQMEKTWDTHKRLARWARNNKTFVGQAQQIKQQETTSQYRRV